MPTLNDEKANGIPVKVHPEIGEVKNAILFYRKEGPIIILEDDSQLDDSEKVKFRFQESSVFLKSTRVDERDLILLEPELVTELNYSPKKMVRVQMYPPSSDDWLSHIVEIGNESIITVQRIIKQEKKLLTIIDKHTSELYHIGMIMPYESNILGMKRDWNLYNEITLSDVADHDIFDILKRESLSWSSLSKLVEGVTIPNLVRHETMEETLNQLVPESFPYTVRRQIMAFLGWLEEAEIPGEDPVDFGRKYRSVEVFRTLVLGHLQCMLDDVEPPKYVRVMMMADRGQLEPPQRARIEAVERNTWNLVRSRLDEMFPDWMGRAVDYAITLQDQGRISTELPVTRDEARKSRKAWSNRFALEHHSLFMRGHVHKRSIGLIPVMYVGAAHRWPQKHLEWSARLGFSAEKPQYIQIMVMPSLALERVARIIPTVRMIDWEMSSFNLSLYSNQERQWKLKTSLITKSIENRRSMRQLGKEFGSWNEKKHNHLTQEQARILDLISWALYLSSLESGQYAKYQGISNSTMKQELDNMLNQGVFKLQYFLIPEKLRSLCIMASGPSDNICSMARSFLKHAPSTQVRLLDEGKSCVIISRVPENEYHNLVTRLTDAANDTGLTISTAPISAYAGYRNNLYSRLLKEDGSWDDDVSGLLSQVRLPPKNAE